MAFAKLKPFRMAPKIVRSALNPSAYTQPQVLFGIEIESIISRSPQLNTHADITQLLQERNPLWSVIDDHSIENDDPLKHQLHCEFVSPILTFNADGISELQSICDILHALDARFNRTCGLHVHFDAEELSVFDIIRIAINYAYFEEVIDLFMDKSRRNNKNVWIQSIVPSMIANFHIFEAVLQAKDSNYSKRSMSLLNMMNPERKRHKMNFTNAFYYSLSQIGMQPHSEDKTSMFINTIENRHHHATMNVQDLMAWIEFNSLFIQKCKLHQETYNLRAQPDTTKKLQLLADFIDNDRIMSHFVQRMT